MNVDAEFVKACGFRRDRRGAGNPARRAEYVGARAGLGPAAFAEIGLGGSARTI